MLKVWLLAWWQEMDQVSLPGLLIHLTGKPCQLLPFATIISSGELPVKPKMSHNNSLVPGAWCLVILLHSVNWFAVNHS